MRISDWSSDVCSSDLDSQSLEISEPGLFKGNATVEDCEISGTFEGDLTVTGLLVVQPTGRVSGRIRYAEMELSRGARVSGDIDVLDAAALRRARGDGPKLAHDTRPEERRVGNEGDSTSRSRGAPYTLKKNNQITDNP